MEGLNLSGGRSVILSLMPNGQAATFL